MPVLRTAVLPRWRLLLVVAVLLAAVIPAAPARAHARLLSSNPAGGATLLQAPTQVRLTFSEPIETDFAQVQVFAPAQQRVDASAPQVHDDTVAVPLVPLTHPGTYTVAFRVISADGHPIEAEFAFELAAGFTAAPRPEPTDATPADTVAPQAGTSPAPQANKSEPATSSSPNRALVSIVAAASALATVIALRARRR